MKILFIQTGGTIDKDYPHTTKGWAFEFGEPATRRILEKLKPSFDFEIITVCQKDSLEITDADRDIIIEAIISNNIDRVVITHGTDTMIETAQYIAPKIDKKCVVITGSMLPERFSNSEASINVGCAIATVQCHVNGVYIAMHGLVKSHDQISRNMETGQFI